MCSSELGSHIMFVTHVLGKIQSFNQHTTFIARGAIVGMNYYGAIQNDNLVLTSL